MNGLRSSRVTPGRGGGAAATRLRDAVLARAGYRCEFVNHLEVRCTRPRALKLIITTAFVQAGATIWATAWLCAGVITASSSAPDPRRPRSASLRCMGRRSRLVATENAVRSWLGRPVLQPRAPRSFDVTARDTLGTHDTASGRASFARTVHDTLGTHDTASGRVIADLGILVISATSDAAASLSVGRLGIRRRLWLRVPHSKATAANYGVLITSSGFWGGIGQLLDPANGFPRGGLFGLLVGALVIRLTED